VAEPEAKVVGDIVDGSVVAAVGADEAGVDVAGHARRAVDVVVAEGEVAELVLGVVLAGLDTGDSGNGNSWGGVDSGNGSSWCGVDSGNGSSWCSVDSGNGSRWCDVDSSNGNSWCGNGCRYVQRRSSGVSVVSRVGVDSW